MNVIDYFRLPLVNLQLVLEDPIAILIFVVVFLQLKVLDGRNDRLYQFDGILPEVASNKDVRFSVIFFVIMFRVIHLYQFVMKFSKRITTNIILRAQSQKQETNPWCFQIYKTI